MVYLNSALLIIAFSMLPQSNSAVLGAGILGFINMKGKYDMIVNLIVPLMRKFLKTKYSAFIYQICQLSGLLMFVIGITAFLGHWNKEEGLYHYNWFGEDIGIAVGSSIGFMVGGLALFFMVLLIDDKIKELEKKYEQRFTKLEK